MKTILFDIINFFSVPQVIGGSETGKTQWIIKLRWIAIMILVVLSVFGFSIGFVPLTYIWVVLVSIYGLFFVNLVTYLSVVGKKKDGSRALVLFQLAFDLLILTVIISVTGGTVNPFSALFFLNVSLGGLLLRGKHAVFFLFLCHFFLAFLQWRQIMKMGFPTNVLMKVHMGVWHFLFIAFWTVTRSLGFYIQQQNEKDLILKLQIERQDRLRAMGALAAGFSHEFASPLNAAKLAIDKFLRHRKSIEMVPDSQIELILDAQESIGNCENVIHRMNSSQLDSRAFDRVEVRVKDLLDNIILLWSEEHPGVKVHFSCSIDGCLNLPSINFTQVIFNLLDNAFETGQMTVVTLRIFINNSQIVLEVEDDGPGFPKEIIERKGEPFLTTKENGTGLGIYVSEIFAQSMGGFLSIKNKINERGSIISISWPQPLMEGKNHNEE